MSRVTRDGEERGHMDRGDASERKYVAAATGTLTWTFSRSSAPVTSGLGSASGGSASSEGGSGGGSASAGAAAAGGTSSGGNPTVYITATGECYHRSGCRYLSSSRIPITLREAREKYRPCSVCDPPQ